MLDRMIDSLLMNLPQLVVLNILAAVFIDAQLSKGSRVGIYILPIITLPLLWLTREELSPFLSVLFLTVWACVCLYNKFTLARFFVGSPITSVAAVLCTAVFVLIQIDQQNELLAQYPLVSLRGRLDYENETPTESLTTEPPDSQPAEELSDQASKRLKDLEKEMGSSRVSRWRTLKLLHSDVTSRFISSPAFGRRRMSFMLNTELLTRMREPELISLPAPPAKSYIENQTESPLVQMQKLEEMHLQSIVSFVDDASLGYIKDIDHVAGFYSHGFREIPKLKKGDHPDWILTQLQLVSLLKHEKPQVYLSKNLPNMEDLQGAPTRELTPFESEALSRMQTGDDLLVDEQPNRLRMLGSLRAAEQCIQCHQVQRGELLGAFSYEFSKIAD